MKHLLPLIALLLAAPARGDDLFRDRVAPLLEARCLGCHNAKTKRGSLDLSSHAGLLTVVAPGHAAKSRLVSMISGDKPRMPRSGEPLSAADVALVRRWIDAGAKWPEGVALTAKGEAPKEETWWSLRPLQRPAVPAIDGDAANPIDRFILAKLHAKELTPSPEADRRTLIRRLSFDLIGLPPTPEEVDAFVADTPPDAYERLVDRLLASPALRRALGPALARRRPLRRHARLRQGQAPRHAWPYRD